MEEKRACLLPFQNTQGKGHIYALEVCPESLRGQRLATLPTLGVSDPKLRNVTGAQYGGRNQRQVYAASLINNIRSMSVGFGGWGWWSVEVRLPSSPPAQPVFVPASSLSPKEELA